MRPRQTATAHRRLLAIVLLVFVPWSFVDAYGQVTLVFPFGMVNFAPLELTDLLSFVTVYTRGLPRFLLSWPIGVGLYLIALASAAAGVLFDREDRRVTALLLVVVGLTQVSMALGFSRRLGTIALPIGAIACWAVVWWFDWATLRGLAPAVEHSDKR